MTVPSVDIIQPPVYSHATFIKGNQRPTSILRILCRISRHSASASQIFTLPELSLVSGVCLMEIYWLRHRLPGGTGHITVSYVI